MTGVVQLLSYYPAPVVESALSIISGIPAKFKFLPSIAEIREHLDLWDEPYRAAEIRAREKPLQIEGPKVPKPTMDELRAKYGPNWGLKTVRQESKNKFPELRDLCAQAGVSVDEIRDAPERRK